MYMLSHSPVETRPPAINISYSSQAVAAYTFDPSIWERFPESGQCLWVQGQLQSWFTGLVLGQLWLHKEIWSWKNKTKTIHILSFFFLKSSFHVVCQMRIVSLTNISPLLYFLLITNQAVEQHSFERPPQTQGWGCKWTDACQACMGHCSCPPSLKTKTQATLMYVWFAFSLRVL